MWRPGLLDERIPYMKFIITKSKCLAVAAAAFAVFGFSAERSEAASLAQVVYTVDSGVVTNVEITAPFYFYPSSGGSYTGNLAVMIYDLYPGNTTNAQEMTSGTPADLLLSVAGSNVSLNGLMVMKGGFTSTTSAGDFAIVVGVQSILNLTTEDLIAIQGKFNLAPSSNFSAPTEGIYSAVMHQLSGGAAPLSNVVPVQVIVNSVPEPGSCLLGLLGTVLVMVRRRR
jgi:hypothetical protein